MQRGGQSLVGGTEWGISSKAAPKFTGLPRDLSPINGPGYGHFISLVTSCARQLALHKLKPEANLVAWTLYVSFSSSWLFSTSC